VTEYQTNNLVEKFKLEPNLTKLFVDSHNKLVEGFTGIDIGNQKKRHTATVSHSLTELKNNDLYEHIIRSCPRSISARTALRLLDEDHNVKEELKQELLHGDYHYRDTLVQQINDETVLSEYMLNYNGAVAGPVVALLKLYAMSNYSDTPLFKAYLMSPTTEVKNLAFDYMSEETRMNSCMIAIGEKALDVKTINVNLTQEKKAWAFNYVVSKKRSTKRMVNNVAKREWNALSFEDKRNSELSRRVGAHLFLEAVQTITDIPLIEEIFKIVRDRTVMKHILANELLDNQDLVFDVMGRLSDDTLVKMATAKISDIKKLKKELLRRTRSVEITDAMIDQLGQLTDKELKRYALAPAIPPESRAHVVGKIPDTNINLLEELALRGVREVFSAAVEKINDEKTILKLIGMKPKSTKKWMSYHMYRFCKQIPDNVFTLEEIKKETWITDCDETGNRDNYIDRLIDDMNAPLSLVRILETNVANSYYIQQSIKKILTRLTEFDTQSIIRRIRDFARTQAYKIDYIWNELGKFFEDDQDFMLERLVDATGTQSNTTIEGISSWLDDEHSEEAMVLLLDNKFTAQSYIRPLMNKLDPKTRVAYILEYETQLTWWSSYGFDLITKGFGNDEYQTLTVGLKRQEMARRARESITLEG